MKLRRLILGVSAAMILLVFLPGTGSAAPYGFVPCQSGTWPKRAWNYSGPQEFALHFGECTDPVYQYFPVLTASLTGTGIRWLPLGPGRVDGLQVNVTGHDLNAEGKDVGLAVCSGVDFPDDCGIQLRGSTVTPSEAQTFQLSREAGDIPEGADRLVLFARCTRDLPDFCAAGGDRVEFSNLYVSLDDASDPNFEIFEQPGQEWRNASPELDITAGDPESGIDHSVISANGGSKSVPLCESQMLECPGSSQVWFPGGIPLIQGRNVVSVAAFNAAGLDSERKFSFYYDTVAPSAPSGLSAVGATGDWVVGDELQLHWTNPTENAPSSTKSGVAGAVVQLEPADGWGNYPTPLDDQEIVAAGIDGAVLELPWEDTWVARVKLFDAAGNQSDFRTLTIDNEVDPVWPPIAGPTPLPTLNVVGTSGAVTFTWGVGDFPRSGDCGYRGWIGTGTPPTLANDPSSQVAPPGATSWTLGASAVSNLDDGVNTLALASVACSGRVSPNFERTLRIDRVPPTVKIDPVDRWLAPGGELSITATDPGAPASGAGVASVWYRLGSGPIVSPNVSQASIPLPQGRHTLTYGATDALGNPSLEAATTVGIDQDAPSTALLPNGDTPGAYIATVVDSVSGLVDAWSEISPVGSASSTRIGDRFVSAQGHRTPVELALRVPDDGSLPPGDYEVRVIARDEAGNIQTTALRTLRLPLRPKPAMTASIASAAHPKVAKKSLTLDLGAKSTLRGRLLAENGTPIVGAILRVVSQRDSGGKRVLGEVRTSAGGLYSLPLGTDVSRTLRVIYVGDASNGPVTSTARVNVRAQISMRLTASRVRAGSRLFAEGKVKLLSAVVPSAGVPVEIQYCARTNCTRVVITKGTDADGGFSIQIPTRYSKRTKLSLRARVRAHSGWPFATGFSAKRSVVVK